MTLACLKHIFYHLKTGDRQQRLPDLPGAVDGRDPGGRVMKSPNGASDVFCSTSCHERVPVARQICLTRPRLAETLPEDDVPLTGMESLSI